VFLKKYGDLIVSIFYIVLSIVLLVLARALPKSKVMSIGPDFMPTVVGILMLLLAVILLVQSINKLRKGGVDGEVLEPDTSDYKRVLASLLLATVYVNILKPVGFLISTFAYLVLQIPVLAPDDKRSKKDLITYFVISLVFTVIVYVLFRYGFKIILPPGLLKF
jgi:hypothetical protein